MGIDQNERKRQRGVDAPKLSTKHPIAALEKRVIDSEAFASLPASAVVVLLLLARNLDRGRNGHVFLSKVDAEQHGVEKKTLYRQLKKLTAYGFIYQTARGGHGRCSKYALTWLPLTKDKAGLHLGNFESCAYLAHESELIAWKKRGGKMSPSRGQKAPQAVKLGDKKPPRVGDKNPHIELIPIHDVEGSIAASMVTTTAAEPQRATAPWQGQGVGQAKKTPPRAAAAVPNAEGEVCRIPDDAPAASWDSDLGEFRPLPHQKGRASDYSFPDDPL